MFGDFVWTFKNRYRKPFCGKLPFIIIKFCVSIKEKFWDGIKTWFSLLNSCYECSCPLLLQAASFPDNETKHIVLVLFCSWLHCLGSNSFHVIRECSSLRQMRLKTVCLCFKKVTILFSIMSALWKEFHSSMADLTLILFMLFA